MNSVPEILRTDVLILGSGVAGLSTAIHLDGRDCLVMSKSRFARGGSTMLAQGGIAAALGPGDSPARHAADTMDAGAGLCREKSVRLMTTRAPAAIRELLDLGAALDRGRDGNLVFGREGAHSRRRIAHASGDATGPELCRILARAVAAQPRIRVLERIHAVDFIAEDNRIMGVYAVDRAHRPLIILAGAVVCATGGSGRLWLETSNPEEATGDGLAMAARAGARIEGLEFVQFHPTALSLPGSAPRPLLSEALRGEGALIVDENGQRFLAGIDSRQELAPRDIVARGIFHHLQDGHRVFLDLTPLGPGLARRFPTVAGLCKLHGFDPVNDLLPVTPAAHYHMGGIITDDRGRTSLDGLYACGEVASTGLHGANRLASNSLLEGLVMGTRIGRDIAASCPPTPGLPWARMKDMHPRGFTALGRTEADDLLRLRRMMWTKVGIIRDEAGLKAALEEIDAITENHRERGEFLNMLEIARLISRAALLRRESRGAHYRRDFPWPSPSWQQNLVFSKGDFEALHPVSSAAAH